MDSKIGFEMSLIVVVAIRGRWTMCEFHESTCNGFGDIWWTDNPIYFSSIDVGAQWRIHSWSQEGGFKILKAIPHPVETHGIFHRRLSSSS